MDNKSNKYYRKIFLKIMKFQKRVIISSHLLVQIMNEVITNLVTRNQDNVNRK